MKRLIIVLIAALGISAAASAQSYNWGVGLRGGLFGGELTAKHYLSSDTAVNLYADLSFNGWGFGLGGDYEFCFPTGASGLEFYVGPGANVGFFGEGLAVAVTGIAGLEYTFSQVPFALFMDYRPRISLSIGSGGFNTGIGYADLALGFRFCF